MKKLALFFLCATAPLSANRMHNVKNVVCGLFLAEHIALAYFLAKHPESATRTLILYKIEEEYEQNKNDRKARFERELNEQSKEKNGT